MPVIRAGVSQIPPYEAGQPIEDVARSLGADPDQIIKLASNESPVEPFPEVIAAIAAAAPLINRYPDNGWHDLAEALAPGLGVETDQLMFGGGSSDLLRLIALAVGGPGTSAVYAWPSFIIYRLASVIAGTETIEVPLREHRHDPEALLNALRTDTTVVYLCNPNNPTGTHLPAGIVTDLVSRIPEKVLVVIDEAYHEYVTAADYQTAISLAVARPNVVVTRTFSKVYGLAGLRVGFAVGQSQTLLDLRRAEAPFTVNTLAQVAARTALGFPLRVEQRARLNGEERIRMEKELASRGVEYVPSQANFVFVRSGAFQQLLARGVIVRPMGDDWMRVTIGTPEENDRFLRTLDDLG
ncbi:MAG TPA: histidinol-phosphate transaminase [Acidimicrobiia bacterium]|nr:histidinol-phosphate transaminase [Acidimicrobiia bacterium]